MNICMFGCGSLGANATIDICRRWGNVVNFTLIDFDKIEHVNLGNQPWFDVNVGQKKATTLAGHVYRVSQVKAVPIIRKITDWKQFMLEFDSDLKSTDLFVDCFDNTPSRNLAHRIARSYKTDILHAGFAQGIFLAAWNSNFPLTDSKVVRTPVCNRRDLATLVTVGAGVTEFIVSRYFIEHVKIEKLIEISGSTLRIEDLAK